MLFTFFHKTAGDVCKQLIPQTFQPSSRGVVGKISETRMVVELLICHDQTSVLDIYYVVSNISFISTGLCGPTATSATTDKVEDEDEDFDEEDSAEADDVNNY